MIIPLASDENIYEFTYLLVNSMSKANQHKSTIRLTNMIQMYLLYYSQPLMLVQNIQRKFGRTENCLNYRSSFH